MGTTQPTTKGNKDRNSSPRRRRRRRGVFSFGACFGLCSSGKEQRKNLYQDRRPYAAAAHDHGDAVESVRHGSEKPEFSKSDGPKSIREIQMVSAAAKAPPPPAHRVNSKIDPEVIVAEEKMNENQQEQSINPEKVQGTSSNRPAMIVKLRQSVSLPAQPRLRKGKTAAAATGEGMAAAGRVDSMVGASMIGLTLVVMLIWGKICAILCSAAWVFFLHCFKQSNESSFEHKNVDDVSSNHRILDLDSHEYKKRVVLKGFLERI